MRAIGRISLLIIGLGTTLILGACTAADPTSVEAPAVRVSHDNGLGFGSGNEVSPPPATPNASVSDSASVGRNGLGFGSGN